MNPSFQHSDPARELAAKYGLDLDRLPRHLAVIMDGNGRWAQSRGWRRVKGHEAGADSVRAVVETCRRLEISYLTLYAFSQENWARPQAEVSTLMRLLARFLKKECDDLKAKDIRLEAIGELERLPRSARQELDRVREITAGCQGMVLTLALSYGGRQELVRAARLLCQEVADGSLDPSAVDEEALADRLYTAGQPDPDLLIRTSGEQRISNYLLWQSAYAEFLFTPILWPDFREAELAAALKEYAGRQRRFGKTSEQIPSGGTLG
jgi:undecaprenyl diphosphate synthase